MCDTVLEVSKEGKLHGVEIGGHLTESQGVLQILPVLLRLWHRHILRLHSNKCHAEEHQKSQKPVMYRCLLHRLVLNIYYFRSL